MDRPRFDEQASHPGTAESAAGECERLAAEAEFLARAQASVDARFYVDGDEVDAWLASIGTDQELPLPPVRRR